MERYCKECDASKTGKCRVCTGKFYDKLFYMVMLLWGTTILGVILYEFITPQYETTPITIKED